MGCQLNLSSSVNMTEGKHLQKNCLSKNMIPSTNQIYLKKSNLINFIGKIHHIDCIKLMSSIPSDSINMIFADPPFNLNKKYKSYKDNLSFDQYIEWTERWLKEACRILKPDGSVFVYNIPRLLIHTVPVFNQYAEFRHWIAWNSNGQPLGKTLQPAHYGILFYTKTKKIANFMIFVLPIKHVENVKNILKTMVAKNI